MQRTTLKVRMSILKILTDSAQVLTYSLEELDSKTSYKNWTLIPTYGTTLTTVCYESCEPKKLTC